MSSPAPLRPGPAPSADDLARMSLMDHLEELRSRLMHAVGAVLGPMFQIIERAYEARGGQDPNLPGGASVTGPNGRADIRIQIDEAGELYVMSLAGPIYRISF